MQMVKAWLDKNMEKLISKKMTAFIVSTVLLCVDKVEPSDWMQICIAYIGSQAAVDLLATFKGTKK